MKKLITLILSIICMFFSLLPVYAKDIPQEEVKDYKVSFYAFTPFNMQDENGKKSGYGYDMLQQITHYLPVTFSYVGYDKTAKECEEMLRKGELDIYTAARKTEEREKEFAFSTHPAITSYTCMNVKVGNNRIVAGDYSTYNGIKIGLLDGHTYNNAFIEFTKEKGFNCQIIYYDTQTALSNALVNDEVDALVNSYIRTPEDEVIVENFGATPYYFMARKEDQELMNQLDSAIDHMNVDTPNWRTNLYNQYYGADDYSDTLTSDEAKLLNQLKEDKVTIHAVMNPDNEPYAWYEDESGKGIVLDIFKETVKQLGLDYELLKPATREEYDEIISSGKADICLDMDSFYEDETNTKYKLTNSFLSTTVSVLRKRGSSSKLKKIGILEDNIAIREIISSTWPEAETIRITDTSDCFDFLAEERVDGILLMSYTAQKLARDDVQNRFSVDIVPGSQLSLKMGINANLDHNFYGIFNKTLASTSDTVSAEIVQKYLQETANQSFINYLYDNPSFIYALLCVVFVFLFVVGMYLQSNHARKKQLHISEQLSSALIEAKSANDAKINFFSKMSHDIRTPLNVVLGMTQVAKKYRNDSIKLNDALNNITTEGTYLLNMINSILDVNQLEHGHIEFVHKPFDPNECMTKSIELLKPLAERKEQKLTMSTNFKDHVIVGDEGRYSQIIVNIVSNAIKYTPAGGKIDVSLEALENNRYRFTCKDNGIGMTQEFVKHICEDYSREVDSRISSVEGTGLGMSVVNGFTHLMNGTLQIDSELGKGSVFAVTIPFDEPSIKERDSYYESKVILTEQKNDYKGKKALLAEDNALNAEIAMEILQDLGFTVDIAENGQIAVDRFEHSELNEYSVIFMDMQMPVLNGVEATKLIRASSRNDRDIPIYAMTANTLTRDRNSCLDAGMNGYISKPIDHHGIQVALKEKFD